MCYSKSTEMLYKSIRLLIYYLKHGQLPPFSSSFLTVQYRNSSWVGWVKPNITERCCCWVPLLHPTY
ncbi:putative transposase [Arthrospira platensis NIES-39]|nr:putative transposase [Arthrospira platensis NIES-39]